MTPVASLPAAGRAKLRIELWAGKTLVADSEDKQLWAKIMFLIGAALKAVAP